MQKCFDEPDILEPGRHRQIINERDVEAPDGLAEAGRKGSRHLLPFGFEFSSPGQPDRECLLTLHLHSEWIGRQSLDHLL